MTSRPGVRQQDAQDLELARRQVDAASPSTRDLVRDGVELERPDGDPSVAVGGRPGRAPEGDAEAGVQLVDAERLGHVVVGAALEGLDLLALLVPAGQDHDRRGRLAPDAADHVEPVDVGQPEVEQDDVGPAALPAMQRGAAVGGLIGPVAARRRARGRAPPRLVVVLDDEDGRSPAVLPCRSPVGRPSASPSRRGSAARPAGRCRSRARRARCGGPRPGRPSPRSARARRPARCPSRTASRRRRPGRGRTCRRAAAALPPGRPARRPRSSAGRRSSATSARPRSGSRRPGRRVLDGVLERRS